MGYQKHNWVTREIIRRQLLQNIEDGIYNEQERAIAAEVELGAALSTETSRAVEKENQLNASIVNVNNALTSEVSRATTKENALQTSISNETTRATGVEGQLSTNISNVSSSLSTEVSRAMAAESTLQGNIDSEETRASAAEATLSSNIAAERTRAQNAESDLHDYVDQQITRTYKPSGSIYFAELPTLSASRLGNVYDIKDAFTTTSDFAEGAGKSYPVGTNVAIVDIGNNTLKYDVLPGFVDTSLFYNTGDSTETTIADSDYFPFYDVSATSKRKTLFSNFRSKLNIPGIATLSKAGIVKPDGTTTSIDSDGTIHSLSGGQATAEAAERMIAPIEPDASASTKVYTVGQKLILNEILYKAKIAIAIGDELVVGTNIELADNVSTQLDSKANKTEAFLTNETTENTLANDDTVPFYDTSASSKRKTTWSNIVAKIKASLSKSDVGLGNVPNVSTNDQTPTFSQASSRANIASGEKLSTIFGKIMKVIADLKSVAFSGSYTDLTNRPTIGLPIQDKGFDANYKTSYRTETKGDADGGAYISAIRTNDSVADAAQYGSGLAWGEGDTHGYLNVSWQDTNAKAYIGGGNGDRLNWVGRLYNTKDNNDLIVSRGWITNGVSIESLENGVYYTNPNAMPTEVASLISSYSYFSQYGTLFKCGKETYPIIEYMDVFANVARWNDNQNTWRPFRRPTGNATAAQVLSGYSFSNESSDGLSGSMPYKDYRSQYPSLATGHNGTGSYVYIPYGYYAPVENNDRTWFYLTDSQAQSLHKHTATKTPTSGELNSSAMDLGDFHGYKYVNTAVCYERGLLHYATNRNGFVNGYFKDDNAEYRMDLYDMLAGTTINITTDSTNMCVIVIKTIPGTPLASQAYFDKDHPLTYTFSNTYDIQITARRSSAYNTNDFQYWWSVSNPNY